MSFGLPVRLSERGGSLCQLVALASSLLLDACAIVCRSRSCFVFPDPGKLGRGARQRHQCLRGDLDGVAPGAGDGVRSLRQPHLLRRQPMAARTALGAVPVGGRGTVFFQGESTSIKLFTCSLPLLCNSLRLTALPTCWYGTPCKPDKFSGGRSNSSGPWSTAIHTWWRTGTP